MFRRPPGETFKGAHEPLISMSLFKHVQDRRIAYKYREIKMTVKIVRNATGDGVDTIDKDEPRVV